MADRLRGFRQGLKEVGYVEGENVEIVHKWAEDRMDRLGQLDTAAIQKRSGPGINFLSAELGAKRLELLRDLLPQATRIGVLVNPADVTLIDAQLKEVTTAVRAMGLQIQVHNADTRAEIDAAFEAMGRERSDAFHRLPAIYALRDYAAAGGPDELRSRHCRCISSGWSLIWPHPARSLRSYQLRNRTSSSWSSRRPDRANARSYRT